ncbi:MAG: response regulator [Deltaproteobacteria bacterium]|nr:MAG: response regulator [Deltaproteobacteria bacterium]
MSKAENGKQGTDQQEAFQDLERTSEEGFDTENARKALLSNLRHKLRTPLNAIIGYSEMLLEDAKDLGQDDFVLDLKNIHHSGGRLLDLVNEILDPGNMQTGIREEVIEALGAKLRFELSGPVADVIGYSGRMLERAKELRQEDFVQDLDKIHSAATRFLAFIKDIVNLLRIEADRMAPGLGEPEPSSKAMDVIIPLAGDVPTQLVEERGFLLVVDDNDMNRDFLSRHLERQGHKVEMAEDGLRALEMIREQPFDLVLLDIMMPNMNGFEVLRYLKTHQTWRHIPVLMISALDEMDSVVRCIEMGAEDYLLKPFDSVLLKARVNACLEKKRLRDQEIEQRKKLSELNKALEIRNRFILATFGRYISDEIVESILETPEGLKLGGEMRTVTILMSDIRGFTPITERLTPEDVVSILNIYLEAMTEVIQKYQGTINEFIGDAILVIFGAPIELEDHARRAVACALEMQMAMAGVNERNREAGYPELEMGIGINTGELVVGNIGSKKRAKYGVVGSNVILTSRIESFTKGGQILVSESTVDSCGPILSIDDSMEVMPKGVNKPIPIYQVGGIGGEYNLYFS